MELTKEQLKELATTGKVELGHGEYLRFTEEPDTGTWLGDFDCYGEVYHIWRGGQSERPDGFDGMAEKIHTEYDSYWWQPPADLKERWHDKELRNHLRDTVREILDYGFSIYKVEWCRGECVHGDPIIVEYATIGGVEPLADDDDKVSYLSDLVWELSDTCVGVA